MSFSYEPGAATGISNVTRVRFHTGQTVEDESLLSDEEIGFALAECETWQHAVIMCLQQLILKFSKPGFRADWLQVDYATARAGYLLLLADKRREFKLQTVLLGTTVAVYRSDSLQTEAGEDW
jgi:hypothetical protein